MERLAWPSNSWITRRSAPRLRRWVAKEWRSACGVAVCGRPRLVRSLAIKSCTMRGLSRPPLTPTKSGPCDSSGCGHCPEIVRDRLLRDGQHRREPFPSAFTYDAKHVARRQAAHPCGSGRALPKSASPSRRAAAERPDCAVPSRDDRFARRRALPRPRHPSP